MARAMKHSGVDWLGDIPADWNICRIGQLYTERREKVSDIDFPPLSVTMKGILPQLSSAAKSDAHDDRKLVRKGDFAINSRSDRRGSCGTSPFDGSVSLINTILTPREGMHPLYYDWLFHSTMFADEFYKWGHGIVDDLWTTHWQDMKKIYVLVPPIDEQERIAAYLDDKCGRIDSVVEKTRASIEEYRKLKQAIITRAVTKGIRPNRPTKESGIEWLGDIPADWKIIKMKYISRFMQTKYSKDNGQLNYIGLENVVGWSGAFIETDSVYDLDQSLICEAGDILFGKLRPYLAKVYLNTSKQCCSGEFAVIRIDDSMCKRFFWYQLMSHGFIFAVDSSTYGTKMPRANVEFIKNISVVIPPLDEQEEIVQSLEKKTAAIDSLIEKKGRLVNELESMKKSLIFEYVTGKKESV